MTTSADTKLTPAAVVDVLTSLLEATVNSVFRYMGEGSPYLSRASADVRKPLADMVLANQRRGGELALMLESLGSPTTVHLSPRPEEQYLAYLSLKFLLPKLVEEKKLCVERYENATKAVGKLTNTPAEVVELLESHTAEQRRELASLEQAAKHVGK